MIRLFIGAIALIMAANSLQSATVTAFSVSWIDVSNAVNTSTAGDTVRIPAGSANWSNMLTVAKAISIIGAGTNATVITYSNQQIVLFSGVTSNLGFRLSSVTFSNTATALANPPSCPLKVQGPLLNFRIDRCLFYKGQAPIWCNGQIEGVIDHNFFVNCETGILLVGDEALSWTRPVVTGTTNCTVIEDNWFYLDNNFNGPQSSHNQDIYQQGGARSAARFNVWDHAGYSNPDSFYDSHGFWTNGYAQPLCEFYLNLITNTATVNWASSTDSRGSSALWWSNTYVLSTVLNQTYLLTLWEEAAKRFTNVGNVYPSPYQVSNTFLWGNTLNGVLVTNAHTVMDTTNIVITQNRDYWMSVPNSTNGSPLGVYDGYMPLAYPHPRVVVEDGIPIPNIPRQHTGLPFRLAPR